MVPTIRVSRQGLTRCPSCRAHIKVAKRIEETACPFCDTSLADAYGATETDPLTGAKRVFPVGRAMLAASLLGLPALSGCGDTDPPPVDNGITTDVQSDQSVALYGMPPDEDLINQPMYGEPPGDFTPSEDVTTDAVDDDLPMAMYGMPADMGPPSDTMEDAEPSEDVVEDVPVQPLYGIPMDMGPGEDVAEDATEDAVEDTLPVALYGMPPNFGEDAGSSDEGTPK